MLENLLSTMRTPQQQPAAAYGAAGPTAAALSLDHPSANPGAVYFNEDHLHSAKDAPQGQIREAVRYLPRLKLLMALALAALSLLVFRRGALPPLSRKHQQDDGSGDGAAVAAFFLALAAILPCGMWAVELLEDIVTRRDSEQMGVVVNVVFEHLSEIGFSLWALLLRENRSLCWIKPMMLGCVLLQLLVVLGGSVLAAPEGDERFGSSFGVSTWTTFSTGLIFSCAAFMIPTVYAYTITQPDVSLVVAKKGISASAAVALQHEKVLFLSRALAAAVLLLYVVYLGMVFHAKVSYYAAAGNPNAPSTLSYALQYRESVARVREGRGHVEIGPRLTQGLAAGGAAALCVLDIALSYVLVRCLPAVIASTPLPLPFLLVVLLPLVFGGGPLGAALVISREGRLDVGASIACSGIVHLFLCVLPCIVLVAWAVGAPLDLTFHPFLACMCFISSLVVAQMVQANRVRWLEGAMLVGLHVMVACVCLLGGWHLCYGVEA